MLMGQTSYSLLLLQIKAARPWCFPKTFDVQSVVQYHHNTKAWMTPIVFMQWLKGLERKMADKKHHILLLLDNAPSHIHNLELTYVCKCYHRTPHLIFSQWMLELLKTLSCITRPS